MDFSKFDPSSMNEQQMLDAMAQFVIGAMLEDIEQNLATKVAAQFSTKNVDSRYVDQLACAVYMLSIATPYVMMQIMGGPIKVAHMMLKYERGEKLSLSALTKKIRNDFADVSPIMSKAITEEIMLLTARLCLNDWVNNGVADETTMHGDMYFYLQAVMDRNADIDRKAVKLEGQQRVLAMTPEEQSELPPDVLQRILAWKPEDDLPE